MNKLTIFVLTLAILGYVNAQTCATNATSDGTNCLCDKGYYGDGSTNCSQCTGGSTTGAPSTTTNTGSSVDASACSQCSQNYYMTAVASGTTAAQCTICPTGSGNAAGPTDAGNESQCNVCKENYYMTALPSSTSGAQCSSCPSNSSNTSSSTVGFCTCFDENAIQLSANQSTCVCQNGYAGSVATTSGAASGCSACAANQFSTAGATCTTCASGSTISADNGSCVCNDSSTGTTTWSSSTNVCQCQAGYYGTASSAASGATGSCTQCPTGTTSVAGALTSSDCTSDTTNSSIMKLFFVALFLALLI